MNKHAEQKAGTQPISWSERAFVPVKEAALICGISAASIYGAAKQNKIALHKLGGRSVVASAELKRFLETAATPWEPSPTRAHNTAEARAARTRAAWAGA